MSKLHTTTVIDGTTKHIFVYVLADSDEIERRIDKLLNRGCRRVNSDGTEEWIHFEHVEDLTKTAAARYTWDKSGDRCLTNRVLYRKCGKRVRKTILSTSFRKFE